MRRSASASRADPVCTAVILAVLFHTAALQSVGKGPNPQSRAHRRRGDTLSAVKPPQDETAFKGRNMVSLMAPPPSYCVKFACLISAVIQ